MLPHCNAKDDNKIIQFAPFQNGTIRNKDDIIPSIYFVTWDLLTFVNMRKSFSDVCAMV